MAAKKVLCGECVIHVKRRRRAAVRWRILPCFKPGRDYTIAGAVGKVRVCLCARHARLIRRRSSFTVEVAA